MEAFASKMPPARRSTRGSRQEKRERPLSRCAASSAPTCSPIGRTGRSSTIHSHRTIPLCCCRRFARTWPCFTRRWPMLLATFGSGAVASSSPWRTRPRKAWSRSRSCSRGICSRTKRWRPVPSPPSTSKQHPWCRAEPGHLASASITPKTARTSSSICGWPAPDRVFRITSRSGYFLDTMDDIARSMAIRPEEVFIYALSRQIGEARHVAVGANSPLPAAAALLAQHWGNGTPLVSLQEIPTHNAFTDGGRELFDAAGQGRIDVFFLSGAQIDGAANINLVAVGDYEHPKRRFAGSFGSSYLYFVVPRVILFRTEHSRRTLVERVDFVSAPGTSAGNVFRTGGPVALVTNRCLFAFDRGRRRFVLASVHPGHTVEEVLEHTGFDFDRPREVPITPAPSAQTLQAMRSVAARELSEVYPQFASQVFGEWRVANSE